MPINSWFKEWFDSGLSYALQPPKSEEAASFINNLHNFLNRPSMRVLDMACGKGRACTNLCKPRTQSGGL